MTNLEEPKPDLPIASAASLLAVDDYEYDTVVMEEWKTAACPSGQTVRLRGLSGTDKGLFEAAINGEPSSRPCP